MANQKNFKQAPLPFVGQKRQFLKHFEQVLNDNIPGNGEGWIIIDAFGGSGLLSHTAKQLKPEARVIYNDFDGYPHLVPVSGLVHYKLSPIHNRLRLCYPTIMRPTRPHLADNRIGCCLHWA